MKKINLIAEEIKILMMNSYPDITKVEIKDNGILFSYVHANDCFLHFDDVVKILKEVWISYPEFELENEAGFEDYREELLQFRLQKEAEWAKERKELHDLEIKGFKEKYNEDIWECLLKLDKKIDTMQEVLVDTVTKLFENNNLDINYWRKTRSKL